jgi:hypothetical protein
VNSCIFVSEDFSGEKLVDFRFAMLTENANCFKGYLCVEYYTEYCQPWEPSWLIPAAVQLFECSVMITS